MSRNHSPGVNSLEIRRHHIRAIQPWASTIAALLFLLAPHGAWGQGWTWEDTNHKTRTAAELTSILQDHYLWVQSKGLEGKPANLSGAKLRGAGALIGDLNGLELRSTDLTDANLGCFVIGLKITLKGAQPKAGERKVLCANLTDADFTDADLTDVSLYGADLKAAVFEPRSLPKIRTIAEADHLEYLTYKHNPSALVQLRKQFQDLGFRTQERKITYALNRRQAELDGPLERWFKNVAFDWTSQYGMNPGRALQIGLVVLLASWLVYAVFMHTSGHSGIYRVQKAGSQEKGGLVEEQICWRPPLSTAKWHYLLRLSKEELRVLSWAGFFSLMSAFNIGFRDINFGRWLRLLPPTELDLKAKGWARTAAGLQSLISVYLIALWVLTYFGRPFE